MAMNATLLFLSGVGFQEILLIGLLVLVFFGARKIPEFMKGLGKGGREYKDAVKDVKKEVEDAGRIEDGKKVIATYCKCRDIRNDLSRGKDTSQQLVRVYLKNRRERSQLNAFRSVYEDEALSVAAQIDEKIRNGK